MGAYPSVAVRAHGRRAPICTGTQGPVSVPTSAAKPPRIHCRSAANPLCPVRLLAGCWGVGTRPCTDTSGAGGDLVEECEGDQAGDRAGGPLVGVDVPAG